MSAKDGVIRVPYSLVSRNCDVKRIVTVYMAIASYAGKSRRAVLSLRDIIYTLGLKPKSGRGRINEQVAMAVNALRDLGFLEQAPEYTVGSKIVASRKYGFLLAPVSTGCKTSTGITKGMFRMIIEVERGSVQISDVPDDGFNKISDEDGESSESEVDDKKMMRYTFSAETAAKTMLAIREVIAVTKEGAAYISRSYLGDKIGISERKITDVTEYLHTMNLIMKRTICIFDAHGSPKRLTFYTNTYGSVADANARLTKATTNYMDHSASMPYKVTTQKRNKKLKLSGLDVEQLVGTGGDCDKNEIAFDT